MDFLVTTWLVRYGHVLGAGLWVGGYALLTIVIMPLIEKQAVEEQANNVLVPLALTTVRVVTYAGTATIIFGLILITRTRGFAAVINGGEWGGIIIACIAIAVALLGMGDGALRPALRQLAETGDYRRVRHLAWIGFVLTILAVGFMTRALYAGS